MFACSGSSCAAGEDFEYVAKRVKRAILFCNYQHLSISGVQILNDEVGDSLNLGSNGLNSGRELRVVSLLKFPNSPPTIPIPNIQSRTTSSTPVIVSASNYCFFEHDIASSSLLKIMITGVWSQKKRKPCCLPTEKIRHSIARLPRIFWLSARAAGSATRNGRSLLPCLKHDEQWTFGMGSERARRKNPISRVDRLVLPYLRRRQQSERPLS